MELTFGPVFDADRLWKIEVTEWATRVHSTANDRLRRASILSGSWLANRVPSKPFSTLDERSEWVWNGVG
jgi:hypothetical protein